MDPGNYENSMLTRDTERCFKFIEDLKKQAVVIELIIRNGLKEVDERYVKIQDELNRLHAKNERISSRNAEIAERLKDVKETLINYDENSLGCLLYTSDAADERSS